MVTTFQWLRCGIAGSEAFGEVLHMSGVYVCMHTSKRITSPISAENLSVRLCEIDQVRERLGSPGKVSLSVSSGVLYVVV